MAPTQEQKRRMRNTRKKRKKVERRETNKPKQNEERLQIEATLIAVRQEARLTFDLGADQIGAWRGGNGQSALKHGICLFYTLFK